MRTEELFYWIQERHNIYLKREAKMPRPWTDDPILQSYRFCNVYRELDKVTLWIAKHWRKPNENNEDLWFAMVVARLVNWPDTMSEMKFPKDLDREQFVGAIHKRQLSGAKAYSGAYIVSTNGNAMDKAEYLFDKVLTPMWARRELNRPVKGDTLEDFYNQLTTNIGLGTFMAAQVVADMKYTPIFKNAPDWWTFAAPGPGSKRGLNWVMGNSMDKPWGNRWHNALMDLKAEIDPRLSLAEMPKMHAQDLQNCLCEMSKYAKAKEGTGRPRSSFPGR